MGQRHADLNCGAATAAGCARQNAELTVQLLDPLGHVAQTNAIGLLAPRASKSNAIVRNTHGCTALVPTQIHRDFGGIRVPLDVGQCLLSDPVKGNLGF